jgi:hypothetical protein
VKDDKVDKFNKVIIVNKYRVNVWVPPVKQIKTNFLKDSKLIIEFRDETMTCLFAHTELAMLADIEITEPEFELDNEDEDGKKAVNPILINLLKCNKRKRKEFRDSDRYYLIFAPNTTSDQIIKLFDSRRDHLIKLENAQRNPKSKSKSKPNKKLESKPKPNTKGRKRKGSIHIHSTQCPFHIDINLLSHVLHFMCSCSCDQYRTRF